MLYTLNAGGILKCIEFNQHPEEQDRIVTCADRFKNTPNNIAVWRFSLDGEDTVIDQELVIDEALPMKATQVGNFFAGKEAGPLSLTSPLTVVLL